LFKKKRAVTSSVFFILLNDKKINVIKYLLYEHYTKKTKC
jgi:hypothetical protein